MKFKNRGIILLIKISSHNLWFFFQFQNWLNKVKLGYSLAFQIFFSFFKFYFLLLWFTPCHLVALFYHLNIKLKEAWQKCGLTSNSSLSGRTVCLQRNEGLFPCLLHPACLQELRPQWDGERMKKRQIYTETESWEWVVCSLSWRNWSTLKVWCVYYIELNKEVVLLQIAGQRCRVITQR